MIDKEFRDKLIKQIYEIKEKLADKESIEKFVIEEKEIIPLYTLLGKVTYILETEQ